MRKLAYIAIFILIVLTVTITTAVFNQGFRDALYNSVVGSLLMPVHDWIVSTAQTVTAQGFTYIIASIFGFMLLGVLTGYVINHWLRPKMPTWLGGTTTKTQPVIYQSGLNSQIPQQIVIPQTAQTVPVQVVQEETKK